MMSPREALLTAALADILDRPSDDVSADASFDALGVDSLAGLRLTRALEDHLGTEVELEWLYDYPSVRELAGFLDARFGTGADAPTTIS